MAVVLITRPEPGATETAIRVASLGLAPLAVPLFSIRQLGYPVRLPTGVRATLLTSRNAVPGCPPSCHDLIVFTVGKATAACAANAGFRQIKIAAGDAVALDTLVSETLTPADGSLFLPVGRRQGGGLASSLRQKGFRVLRYVVYETLMVQTLPVAVEMHLRHGQVGTAMFFSAEAARHFVRLVHAIGLDESVSNAEAGVYQRTASRGIKKAALASYQRRRTAKPGCNAGVTEMSDQPVLHPPEQSDPGSELPPTAPQSTRANLVLWLYGLGFLALGAAIFYVWQYPKTPVETAANASGLRAVEQSLEAIDTRLGRLEHEPSPPTAADLNKINARLDTLESRVSDQTRLASQLDVLSGRVESLSGRGQSGLDAIKQQLAQDADATKQQLAQDAGRTTALENTVDSLKKIPDRISRIVHIQAAEIALAAGRPLGNLPDAPPALSRFAHNAPPTLAQLRLAFPEVEGAALTATESTTASGHFVDRMWERAQGLVTIRQGDQVVVGNALAVGLARAKTALDAGDLVAAVDAIAALDPPDTRRAAAEWLAKAKALIDARSALADMAANS